MSLLNLPSSIPYLMIFLYQLSVLESLWLAPAEIFLLSFVAAILVPGAILLFTWLLEELEDRRHFLYVRRRMREISLLLREREFSHLQKYSSYRTHHAGHRQARRALWRHFKRRKA